MNKLSHRMTSLLLIMFIGIGATGYFSFKAIQKISFYKNQLLLGEEAITFANTEKKKRHSNKSFKRLQGYRAKLDVEKRQDNFSKIIQAYNEKSKYLSKKRVRFFKKSEIKYATFVKERTQFLEKRFLYFLGLSCSLLLLTVFGLFLFVKVSFLRPIKDLNTKMIDFLNEKYTYQFSVPKNNEVGNLQSTFNSLAQQVLSNMDELKQLDKAKSEFLSIASHELRTPLTSIKGSLSLLKQGVAGELNPPVLKLVDIANIETERLIRLINDILDLTKMEAQKLSLNQEWKSLDELIHKTFDSLNGLCETAQIKLDYEAEAPYLCNIDFDRIQQVLTNLLSNAIKFSPQGGTVKLTVQRQDDGLLRINIIDQGPGIAPEDKKLIFQKFRQATSQENPLVKGTGLGLAIAKAIVEQHKGNIDIESTFGEGSCFFFTLPEWKLDMSDSNIKVKPEAA